MKVIFAQGNPGSKYEQTRHNIGALILDAYASSVDATWKNNDKFQALVAETNIKGEKTLLVFPQTYYNDTGISARRILDFYKLDPATDLLVLHDDLALPFGTIRTRTRGSDAGNNGIKSLNRHIDENYHRVRIGISTERHPGVGDVDYVLGHFSKDELATITDTLAARVHTMIDSFVEGKLAITSETLT